MKEKILEDFDKIIKDLESPTIAKLEVLVNECLKFFDDLKHIIETGSDEDKKEALELSKKIQKKLEERSDKAYSASGMDKKQIDEALKDPQNFSEEDWTTFSKIKKDISEYQGDVIKKTIQKEVVEQELLPKKKKNIKKTKIQG